MYCTGGGAWVSSDLLNWEYEHVEHVSRIPVAPDVAEYNGKFYMSGNDCPLYVADHPLGPYTLLGDWTNTGTLREGLKASVGFGSDNKTLQLTISEMVTPGESLITTSVVEKKGDDFLYSLDNTTLTLTLTVDTSLAGLAEGGIVELDLISDEMKAAILASLTDPKTGKVTEMVTLKLTDGNTDNDIIAGEDAIVGFFNEKNEGYFGENVGNGVQYNVNLIPEPASATLSLAALMMLCARRRRRA